MLFYYHYNLIHFYRLKKALPRHGEQDMGCIARFPCRCFAGTGIRIEGRHGYLYLALAEVLEHACDGIRISNKGTNRLW